MMILATSMRRTGTPDAVAEANAFLASDDASSVTGTTLNGSGGMAVAWQVRTTTMGSVRRGSCARTGRGRTPAVTTQVPGLVRGIEP